MPRGSQDTQPNPKKQGLGLDIQEEPVCNGQTQNPVRLLSGVAARSPGISFPAEQEPSANLEVHSMH